MLKGKFKFLTLLSVLLILLSSTLVFAEDNASQNDYSINPISTEEQTPVNEETDTDTIIDEEPVSAENILTGDQYLYSQNVSVSTNIDGNLFAMGSTVTINAQIAGDAFIFADNVVIETDSLIFGNLAILANTIEFKGSAYDIYAMCDTLTINQGYTYRDVRASCNTFNVYGTISRNAFVNCTNINFKNGDTQGIIMGNLEYTAKNEANIQEEFVNGDIVYNKLNESSNSIGSYLLSLGTFLCLVIVVWLLLLWIAPNFKERTENLIKNKKFAILLVGFLSLILIPIISIILLLLNITTSVSLLLLIIYFLLVAISESVFIITVNNFIASKLKINKNIGIFGMLIVTAIIFWLLYLIPFNIGFILTLISIILGLGITITPLFFRKQLKKD